MNLAAKSDAIIYAIGLYADANGSTSKAGRRELDRLTERTGGLAYAPASIDQVAAIALDLPARDARHECREGMPRWRGTVNSV